MPAQILLSQNEDDAKRVAYEVAGRNAERLCGGVAEKMGKTIEIAYAGNVASVRAAVPATRQPWRDLPGDAIAGDCYLNNPDKSRTVVVVADGVAPVVRRAHHTSPLADSVPDVEARLARNRSRGHLCTWLPRGMSWLSPAGSSPWAQASARAPPSTRP